MISGILSLEKNQLRQYLHFSPPSITKIRNEWSYNLRFLIRLYVVDKNNSTCTVYLWTITSSTKKCSVLHCTYMYKPQKFTPSTYIYLTVNKHSVTSYNWTHGVKTGDNRAMLLLIRVPSVWALLSNIFSVQPWNSTTQQAFIIRNENVYCSNYRTSSNDNPLFNKIHFQHNFYYIVCDFFFALSWNHLEAVYTVLEEEQQRNLVCARCCSCIF